MSGSSSSEGILEGLNAPQREAVLANDGPVLILAGAGSGKTRALTRKIAYLVAHEGIAPWEILAVTFTNKAASEMRDRCALLVGAQVEFPWLGTFHRVGVRILREHGELASVPQNFVIYDQNDQRAMVSRCIKALGFDKITPQGVQEFIGSAKLRALTADGVAQADDIRPDDRFLRVYQHYEEEMKKSGAVDFSDLLMLPLRIVTENPLVASSYKQRWRYVLVDEFQDTNRVQYDLLLATLNDERRICVVGDDDQCIYRWRGADVDHILGFEGDFPGAKVIRLEQNYRSTGRILAAATALIAENTSRHPKTLWTDQEEGELVRIHRAGTDLAEADYVLGQIRARRSSVPLREIAIFYRTNAQSRPFEDALRRAAIPYRVVGGLKFYDRAEVKDLLAYLKVLVNPADAVSLERIINTPTRGIGKKTVQQLRDHARAHGSTVFDAARHLAREGTPGEQKKLGPFVELMVSLTAMMDDASALTIAREALDKAGFIHRFEAEDTAEADARIQNLQELLNAIEEHGVASADHTLSSYLEQVALVSDLDNADRSADNLLMMTVHTAKGLEFDTVFVTGMELGLFPHFNAMEEPQGEEEERRLAYVAMTRAKTHLTLTCAAQRRRFGTYEASPPSPFLDELPPEAIEEDGRGPARRAFGGGLSQGRSWSRPGSGRLSGQLMGSPGSKGDEFDQSSGFDDLDTWTPEGDVGEGLRPGGRVFHPSFGEGVIVQIDGDDRDAKARVRFASGLEKRIITRFLTRVS
jgi:DNA helicase-2/ATP-dependent DNA helicase PcrA